MLDQQQRQTASNVNLASGAQWQDCLDHALIVRRDTTIHSRVKTPIRVAYLVKQELEGLKSGSLLMLAVRIAQKVLGATSPLTLAIGAPLAPRGLTTS